MTREKEVIYRAGTVILKALAGAALVHELYNICSGNSQELEAITSYAGAVMANIHDAKNEIFPTQYEPPQKDEWGYYQHLRAHP